MLFYQDSIPREKSNLMLRLIMLLIGSIWGFSVPAYSASTTPIYPVPQIWEEKNPILARLEKWQQRKSWREKEARRLNVVLPSWRIKESFPWAASKDFPTLEQVKNPEPHNSKSPIGMEIGAPLFVRALVKMESRKESRIKMARSLGVILPSQDGKMETLSPALAKMRMTIVHLLNSTGENTSASMAQIHTRIENNRKIKNGDFALMRRGSVKKMADLFRRIDIKSSLSGAIDSFKMKAGFRVGRIRCQRRNPPSLRSFRKAGLNNLQEISAKRKTGFIQKQTRCYFTSIFPVSVLDSCNRHIKASIFLSSILKLNSIRDQNRYMMDSTVHPFLKYFPKLISFECDNDIVTQILYLARIEC